MFPNIKLAKPIMLRIFHDFSMEILMHVMIGGLSQKNTIHGLQEVGLLESSWLFFFDTSIHNT